LLDTYFFGDTGNDNIRQKAIKLTDAISFGPALKDTPERKSWMSFVLGYQPRIFCRQPLYVNPERMIAWRTPPS
jgi:hypothetical protein